MSGNKLTTQRLIQLSQTLNAIIDELRSSLDAPEPNPRKRTSRKDERRAYYANLIDRKIRGKGLT